MPDSKQHLLLVEDDAGHAELIRRAFELNTNYTVVTARTLNEARQMLQTITPSLLFVDFALPDGQGIDLLQPPPDCPVIILTSHGSEQIAVEALKAGALDYVVKSEKIFDDMPTLARRWLREWAHIAERRRAEADLHASEAKFRLMLELASEGILLVNSKGKITLVNHAIEQVFGYHRDELLNQSIEFLVPPSAHGSHQSYRDVYLAHPEMRRMGAGREVYGQRADGTTFPVEISLTPVDLIGERHIMCSVVDISERRQLEQQRLYARQLEIELAKERELIELKERFVSLVSHEYRTPLASILSAVELLQRYMDRLPPEGIQKKLNAISEQVVHMVDLMENILRWSRNDHKGIEFRPQPLDLLHFCRHLYENICLTDRNSSRFVFDSCELPPLIYADKYLLNHILTNLLTNAVKYSPEEGMIRFYICHTGSAIEFTIEDQGIGIPEADQEWLYEPFHRASNVKSYPGTGLGLAIVKQNVEAHRGRLSFESALGKGTTFTVRIPCYLSESDAQ